jgi:hypothetical protein
MITTLAANLGLPTSRDSWDGARNRSMDARTAVMQDGGKVHGTIVYIADGGEWAGVSLDGETVTHEWPAASLLCR